MLTRVWGEINGIGMIPAFNVGDKFYFVPPLTLTGRYICQFWAEDDFGNITNETAILTIFEGMVKCIEVITREWAVTMLSDPWELEQDIDPYSVSMVPGMQLEIENDPWIIRMLPIECARNMIEVLI